MNILPARHLAFGHVGMHAGEGVITLIHRLENAAKRRVVYVVEQNLAGVGVLIRKHLNQRNGEVSLIPARTARLLLLLLIIILILSPSRALLPPSPLLG